MKNNRLWQLPVELREMIFRDCVVEANGKAPVIIIALRPDKELYHEALHQFNLHSTFFINVSTGKNMKALGDMSQNLLDTVAKIELRIEGERGGVLRKRTNITPSLDFLTIKMTNAKNLKSIYIKAYEINNFFEAMDFLTRKPSHLSSILDIQSLRKVTIEVNLKPRGFDFVTNRAHWDSWMAEKTNFMNETTGMEVTKQSHEVIDGTWKSLWMWDSKTSFKPPEWTKLLKVEEDKHEALGEVLIPNEFVMPLDTLGVRADFHNSSTYL